MGIKFNCRLRVAGTKAGNEVKKAVKILSNLEWANAMDGGFDPEWFNDRGSELIIPKRAKPISKWKKVSVNERCNFFNFVPKWWAKHEECDDMSLPEFDLWEIKFVCEGVVGQLSASKLDGRVYRKKDPWPPFDAIEAIHHYSYLFYTSLIYEGNGRVGHFVTNLFVGDIGGEPPPFYEPSDVIPHLINDIKYTKKDGTLKSRYQLERWKWEFAERILKQIHGARFANKLKRSQNCKWIPVSKRFDEIEGNIQQLGAKTQFPE